MTFGNSCKGFQLSFSLMLFSRTSSDDRLLFHVSQTGASSDQIL